MSKGSRERPSLVQYLKSMHVDKEFAEIMEHI